MNEAIIIKDLTKKYGSLCALDHVSLTLEPNHIYGLLGRNGAGKTTMLNLINNRIFPTEGEILYGNENVTENSSAQNQFFLMSEDTYYPENMRVQEAFLWTSKFHPSFDPEYAKSLADKFQLNIKSRSKNLSTGYRSIFKLIIALSINVPFIFFDEPVLGLDANHRDLFYRLLLEKYSEKPATYVLSTHLIEEVADIIEDLIIIKQGKILACENKEEFLSKAYTVAGESRIVDAYCQDRKCIGTENFGGLKLAYLLGRPAPDTQGLTVSTPDLQKLFIKLTNDDLL